MSIMMLIIALAMVAWGIAALQREAAARRLLGQAHRSRERCRQELQDAFAAAERNPEDTAAQERSDKAFSQALQAEIDLIQSKPGTRPLSLLVLAGGLVCGAVAAQQVIPEKAVMSAPTPAPAMEQAGSELAPVKAPDLELAAWGHSVPSPLLAAVIRHGAQDAAPAEVAGTLNQIRNDLEGLTGDEKTEATLAAWYSPCVREFLAQAQTQELTWVPPQTREFIARVKADTPTWAYRL